MFLADSGGGSIGPSLNTAGLDVQSMKVAGDEALKLIESAKSGGFKISPEGLAPLKTALAEIANDLEHLMSKSQYLTQAPKLGDHPYGHTVSAHDQKSASEQAGSALEALTKFRQVIRDTAKALDLAAAKYQGIEADALSTIKDH